MEPAERCRKNRALLKSVELWKKGEEATTTKEIVEPYVAATGLHLEQLSAELFRLPQWKENYGGPPWARIADVAVRLQRAMDEQHLEEADQLCDEAKGLKHNTGDLVPLPSEWKGYKREKWPQLCD